MPLTGLGSGFSLGKESTWGTSVTPTRALPILSESLRLEIMRTTSDTLKGGTLIRPSSAWRPAARVGGGDTQHLLYESGATMLLEAALGGISSAANTPSVGRSTHTITPGALPSYTGQVTYGATSSAMRNQFVGAMVDSWEMALAIGENATLGLTWVYKDETLSTGAALQGTAPAGQKPYTYVDGTVTVAGSSPGCVQRMTLRGTNNLKRDLFCLGSTAIVQPQRSNFVEITGELEVVMEASTTLYGQYTAGTELAIVLALAIGGQSPQNTVTITLNARIDGSTPVVSGPDVQTVTVPFVVFAPTTDASAITIVAVNGDTTP